MPITIEMPKLSDTMTEGTLVRWVKKVGDQVEVGDVLAEVETDKATMEMEAFDEGVLGEVYVQDGQKVQIGQKLAILLAPGEEKPGGESGGAAPAAKAKAPALAAPLPSTRLRALLCSPICRALGSASVEDAEDTATLPVTVITFDEIADLQ